MNIGDASRASDISSKMIRYYESIGLIPEAGRTESGYRVYDARDVHLLRFIGRARALGFPVDRMRELLALWQDRGRASADVKAVAQAHIGELQTKIAEPQTMVRSLEHLADHCHGDDRPDCPILEDLASAEDGETGPSEGPRLEAHRGAAPRSAKGARRAAHTSSSLGIHGAPGRAGAKPSSTEGVS